MKHYDKRKVIRIRNPDCKNLREMQQNYSGLWRALGLSVTRNKRGFQAMTKTHTYQLEV